MRAVEFIRGLLDLIDDFETPEVNVTTVKVDTGVDDPLASIKELLPYNSTDKEFENEPDEKYANIHSTTTSAGGGVNGPKNPADLRGNSVNIYPRGE
jgi:hypothetical protein